MTNKIDMTPRIKNLLSTAAWILIVAVSLVYILRTNDLIYFQGGDNAHYALLGKALAEGRGYRDVFKPGQPAHTQYPPLFPMLLSGAIRARGMDSYYMKMVVSFFAAASLILLFLLLRQTPFASPLPAAVWLGTSYIYFNETNSLLTESTYTAFSLAALVLFELWRERRRFILLVPPVLACWAAIMTRSIGITLAAALAAAFFFNEGRSKKSAGYSLLLLAACLLPFIGWVIRNAAVSDVGSNYFSQFFTLGPHTERGGPLTLIAFIERMARNAGWYFGNIRQVVGIYLNFAPKPLAWLVCAIVWGLFATGFYERIRHGPGAVELYTVFYFAMIVTWPYLGARFLMCILPLVLAYAVHGAWFSIGLIPLRKPRRATAGLALLIFSAMTAINIIYNATLFRMTRDSSQRKVRIWPGQNFYVYPPYREYERLLWVSLWLREHSAPGGIVMARKPRLVALVTGRPTMVTPDKPPLDPDGWIKEKGVRYIVVDEAYESATRFVEALKRYSTNPDKYRVVAHSGETYVIKVLL